MSWPACRRRTAACRFHLIEDHAERPDVAASVGLLPLDLLRRHVVHCAENRALRGRRRGVASRVIPDIEIGPAGARNFASPKSSSFAPVFVSMMLAGLRSRCDDPLPMRLVERVGNLGRRSSALPRCGTGPFSGGPLGEGFALQIRHDDEVRAVGVADVVDAADVRMVERRDGSRLAVEPLAESGRGQGRSGRTLIATVRSSVCRAPCTPRPCRLRRAAR